MNKRIYDISLLAGILLVAAGVAQWSVPAALVTTGALVIGLTLLGAAFGRKG